MVEAGIDATPETFIQIKEIMLSVLERKRYQNKMEQMNQINLQFA